MRIKTQIAKIMDSGDPFEARDAVNRHPRFLAEVAAEWKDMRFLVDQLLGVIEKLGGEAIEDPIHKDSDTCGFIIIKKGRRSSHA